MTSDDSSLSGKVADVTGAARGDHLSYIHSFSPAALPTDSLISPDQVSDVVVWLAGDASALIPAEQIPAEKGYLKI